MKFSSVSRKRALIVYPPAYILNAETVDKYSASKEQYSEGKARG